MKKRIYLHIGTHKTGTTSLQAWAVANTDALAAQGVLYPKTGRMGGGNHSPLAWAIAGDSRGADLSFETLLAEIRATPHPKILISGEEFELLSADRISALATALSEFDTRILAVFRPQPDLIRSQYAEWTKQLLTTDHFSVFWRYFQHQPELDYSALIRPWIEGFGPKHVRLLPYSSLSPSAPGVLPTLLAELGLEPDLFDFPAQMNTSASAETLALWRYLAVRLELVTGASFSVQTFGFRWRDMRPLGQLRDLFRPVLQQTQALMQNSHLPETRFNGFTPDELKDCAAHFDESNHALFECAGTKLWSLQPEAIETNPGSPKITPEIVQAADGVFDAFWAQNRETIERIPLQP